MKKKKQKILPKKFHFWLLKYFCNNNRLIMILVIFLHMQIISPSIALKFEIKSSLAKKLIVQFILTVYKLCFEFT